MYPEVTPQEVFDFITFKDDDNLGEVEFMLENERKKFREAKEKY
jgi:hypothetical protein